MQDTNKCALVTASSKGLGKAIAKEFINQDYRVILHGRDKNKLLTTREELGSNVIDAIVGDLRSEVTVEKLYNVSKERISVLVNNAAIPCYGLPLDEMGEDQVWESLETNLVAPIKLTKKIYPLLKK